ncbi:transposase family protein [Streptomyces violascens]|uniref:transposase family protein n=1 Tax=Streptomyces violascens TaxID=67381 RepID=UPI0027E42C53|nr:transposase family protein [Streptomyces violascens]
MRGLLHPAERTTSGYLPLSGRAPLNACVVTPTISCARQPDLDLLRPSRRSQRDEMRRPRQALRASAHRRPGRPGGPRLRWPGRQPRRPGGHHRGQADPEKKLTAGQKQANQLIAATRAPVEHGFAALKNWRVLTRLRLNPARATALLRALLVLTALEVAH